MPDHEHAPAKSRNFSLAFEQMCSFVAIAKTKDADETLRELILQCFVVLPDEAFASAAHLTTAIDTLFGLQVPEREVQIGLDVLETKGLILCPPDANYALPLEVRAHLQKKIDDATELENRVKQEWLEETARNFPLLSVEIAWSVLRNYLARAFRRHGIQTTALLDPTIEVDGVHQASLSALLKDALKGTPLEQQGFAKSAISSFLASAGKYPDRATYIAQLADGAFNYFSLTVAPDVAEQFRQKLSPLKLFLDTNFLFGILDLTINPQVAVSNELLRAVGKYKLPFELRFHQKTEEELESSINHYKDILLSYHGSRGLSRAASTSWFVSGAEQRYYQEHAETGIDVESFFLPYQHVDVLLREKNILIYRPGSNRLHERAYLFNEYKAWLAQREKTKPDELIDHDTTVLDQVRQLRSNTKTSLEAGALLITCDYALYGFDWELSRLEGHPACTVLPNSFWQILRPYIPSDTDFERSFAETFAIPEFRTLGSGATRACTKMLHILSSYKDLSEDTAARMLSNDLLIGRLRTAENDEQFQEYVEIAIVAENATLVEERAIIESQLDQERTSKAELEQKVMQLQREHEQEVAEAERARQEAEENYQKERDAERARADLAASESDRLRRDKEEAEKRADDLQKAAEAARQGVNFYISLSKAAVGSIVSIAIFELAINLIPWSWLVNHPQSYGLQFSFDALLICLNAAIFVPKWRTGSLIAAAISFASVIGQLLGGPKQP